MIPAAGTVPWRRRKGTLEVLLVHRPRYDDWSWPKGKLDPGEKAPVAAARETLEETGYSVRLGIPLPTAEYVVFDRTGRAQSKTVHYWAAQVTGGDGALVNEIDQAEWLETTAAYDRLDYARDKDQLRALVRADQDGTLETWPVVLVRHARSVPRGAWGKSDDQRPLTPVGEQQAGELSELLAAYEISRVVSSPWVRCVQTVQPYADRTSRKVKLREPLTEDAFEADPAGAVQVTTAEVERGKPTAVCGHGPALPSMVGVLAARVREGEDVVAAILEEAAGEKLVKGEALVAHCAPGRKGPVVVAVERHLP